MRKAKKSAKKQRDRELEREKYKKIYNQLIEKCRNRSDDDFIEDYYEFHHIIPRSIGGLDEDANIVKLTLREHYICHWLLSRIHYNTDNWLKMARAFNVMNAKRHNKDIQYISVYGKKEGVNSQKKAFKFSKTYLEGGSGIETHPLWDKRIEIFNRCYNKGGAPAGAYYKIVAEYNKRYSWEEIRSIYIRVRRSLKAKVERYKIDDSSFETYDCFIASFLNTVNND